MTCYVLCVLLLYVQVCTRTNERRGTTEIAGHGKLVPASQSAKDILEPTKTHDWWKVILTMAAQHVRGLLSEAVYTCNFFPTACRTACKHAFCFLRVRPKPRQHATLGCDKRWMTCIHAGVSRSPREHASVPPDKRHCQE